MGWFDLHCVRIYDIQGTDEGLDLRDVRLELAKNRLGEPINLRRNLNLKVQIATGVHKSRATKFCMGATNVSASSVWKLLHVTFQAPIVLRRLQHSREICALLYWHVRLEWDGVYV